MWTFIHDMLPLRSVGRSNFVRVCVNLTTLIQKRHILMRTAVLYIYTYRYITYIHHTYIYMHTYSIRQKKLLPLPLHFNADGHNNNDLKVCIMNGNFKDTEHRKQTEFQFIINFQTNKFGVNKDISFLSRYDTPKHKG